MNSAPVMKMGQQDMESELHGALVRAFSRHRNPVKQIADVANSNIRTARNWWEKKCAPGSLHLLRLMAGELEQIGAELIADAAGRAPAKVLARSTGLTERHIRSLRQREHQPGWAAFMALAQHAPELKAAVARWLQLTPPTVAGADQALAEIRRLVASLPEAGDMEQPE